MTQPTAAELGRIRYYTLLHTFDIPDSMSQAYSANHSDKHRNLMCPKNQCGGGWVGGGTTVFPWR